VSELISEELKVAYADTEYWVETDTPFFFTVNNHSPQLSQLMAQHNCTTAAYITASNPFSQPMLSCDWNRVENERLRQELSGMSCSFISGQGRSFDGGWVEESYLILGISRAQAHELAAKYLQSAYIFIDSAGIPELVCRDLILLTMIHLVLKTESIEQRYQGGLKNFAERFDRAVLRQDVLPSRDTAAEVPANRPVLVSIPFMGWEGVDDTYDELKASGLAAGRDFAVVGNRQVLRECPGIRFDQIPTGMNHLVCYAEASFPDPIAPDNVTDEER
jgi:hypothetical protein